jgi:hypothetical protein
VLVDKVADVSEARAAYIFRVKVLSGHPKNVIADFRLLRWLIVDVNSVLRLLHRVVLGDVADVSDAHAVSTFRVEVFAHGHTE